MFGKIGAPEVILILGVVLLIFGPSKLPSLAKAVGKSVVELKDGLKGKGKDESVLEEGELAKPEKDEE